MVKQAWSGKNRKPGIPTKRPEGIKEDLWRYLTIFKELIESYEGVRGDDDDRVISRADLKSLGLDKRALDSPTYKYDFINNLRLVNPIKYITADYEMQIHDYYLIVDTTSGDINITCLNANNIKGYDYTIKKVSSDSNSVIVTPFGSQTINGVSPQIIYGEGDAMNIISDNDNWHIV